MTPLQRILSFHLNYCSCILFCMNIARISRSAPIDQKLFDTTASSPDMSDEHLNYVTSNEVELTELAWIAVELSDLRVSIKTLECYHFSKYINPLLSVSLEDSASSDGDAPQRRAQTWRLGKDWRLPPGLNSGRFVTYYYGNASLATALVGHNKDFRDPLRKPEILASSEPVGLAEALKKGELQMRGLCYNVSASVRALDMSSLVPTTTEDPVAAMAAARAVESPLYHVSMDGGGPLARAAAPLWMLLLAAVVFLVLFGAFVMLFVVHVRARKRYASSTCAGLSPSSFGSKPASAFSHRSHSGSGCRSLKLACSTAAAHNTSANNNLSLHMINGNGSAHTLSHANTSGSTIYQFQPNGAPMSMGGMPPHGHAAVQLPPIPAAVKHTTVVRAHSNSDAESHYDVPWDHKYRPLPDWLRTDLASTLANDGRPPPQVPVRPVPPPGGVTILCDSGVEST